ncbi:MAG: hypothetical protein V4521_07335, partial [Pseudomonadota bacterium]
MSNRNRFAWPLAASAALVAMPAMAQDAQWDRDSHFDGVYVQGAGGIALNGENGSSFSFDTNRDGNYGETVTTTTGANAFGPGFCNGGANGRTRADGCRKDRAGVDYAARIGFDKRAGNIVFGALIEGSDNEMKERSSAFSTTPAAYRIDREMRYAISARARLGFTPGGGALFYATGGGSYAKINHDFSTTNTANSFTENNDGKMVWGYQAGGGTEIMVTNKISLGLEYLYSRYKDNKYTVAVGPGTAAATNPFLLNGGGTNLRLTDKYFDTHSLRATVGFRF